MNKIIEQSQQTYEEAFDSFCFQNSVINILHSYGITNAIAYLNLGVVLKLEQKEGYHIIHDTWEECLLPAYRENMQIEFSEKKDADKVRKTNYELVRAGIPLIIVCDSFFLPYTPFYKRSHGNHTVIMYDVDDQERKIKITDRFHTWNYKGFIDADLIMKARMSENEFDGGLFSGQPIELAWAKLECDKWEGRKEELIFENLNRTVSGYYVPEQDNCLYGKNAYQKICCLLNEGQDVDFYEMYTENYYFIKKRALFLYFLNYIYSRYMIGDERILQKYTNNLQTWNEWQNIVLKEGLKRNGRLNGRICGMYLGLIQEEQEIIDGLEKLAGSIRRI